MQATFVTLNDDMRGYLALPEAASPVPAVLVYMEAFGLNAYVQAECRRLAAHGFAALAPDFYRGEIVSYDERSTLTVKLQQLTDEKLLADIRLAIAYLDQ